MIPGTQCKGQLQLPAMGRQRQDSWDLLTSYSGLIGKPQVPRLEETRRRVPEEKQSRLFSGLHLHVHTDTPVHTHIHIISVTTGRSCVMEYRDLCFVKNIISVSEWVLVHLCSPYRGQKRVLDGPLWIDSYGAGH